MSSNIKDYLPMKKEVRIEVDQSHEHIGNTNRPLRIGAKKLLRLLQNNGELYLT